MSHLYLIISNEITSTSAHTYVFVSFVKQLKYRRDIWYQSEGLPQTEDAYYTRQLEEGNENIILFCYLRRFTSPSDDSSNLLKKQLFFNSATYNYRDF